MNPQPIEPLPEIVFAREGRLGLVTLNRPGALNALTHAMARSLAERLRVWGDDPAVAAVAITGAGERAFCAGGDVRDLYDARLAPDRAFHREFYRDEYRLNRRIYRYRKPYVALIDGIVMGGGVGISIHGRFRAVSEKAVFAMPETGIGLFPDVGGSHFLSRCPGRIGLYLGLSGARLGAADMVYAGLATHFVPRGEMPILRAALASEPPETNAVAFWATAKAMPERSLILLVISSLPASTRMVPPRLLHGLVSEEVPEPAGLRKVPRLTRMEFP